MKSRSKGFGSFAIITVATLSLILIIENQQIPQSFAQNNNTQNVTVSPGEDVSVVTDTLQLETNVTENGTVIIDPQQLTQEQANQTNVSVTENGTVILQPPAPPEEEAEPSQMDGDQQQGQDQNQTGNILDQISQAFSNLFGG